MAHMSRTPAGDENRPRLAPPRAVPWAVPEGAEAINSVHQRTQVYSHACTNASDFACGFQTVPG